MTKLSPRAMPVSFQVDKTASLIRTRCYGYLTYFEVLDHFRALRDEVDLPNPLNVFLDLREVTSSPTADQIRKAGEGPAFLLGVVGLEYCAVVANRDVIYGMARMWAVFVEGFFKHIEVFRSVAEADAWLRSPHE